MLLQEHWLLPDELGLLNNVHKDFIAWGSSAVNITDDVRHRRPYGGTTILYKKCIAQNINVISLQNTRLSAITLSSDIGKLLIVNVYAPCDYGSVQSMDEYNDLLGALASVLLTTLFEHCVIAGDFNCDRESRFYPLLVDFVHSITCMYRTWSG